jgi:sporulation protein YlmC with PRC-barrel domain
MKNVLLLPLAAFCLVSNLSCAQLPQTSTPAAETGTRALDARWTSAIIGMPVESSTGQKLGRVQDVIVDGYGHSAFAILSYRGTSASGTKYAAVPWNTVADMLDRDRLVVDHPVLQNAPALAGAGADARGGAWRRDAELYWSGKVASAR